MTERKRGRRSEQPLLTPKEAAEYYNVSLRTIRRRVAAGDFEVVRIGRLVRIRRREPK